MECGLLPHDLVLGLDLRVGDLSHILASLVLHINCAVCFGGLLDLFGEAVGGGKCLCEERILLGDYEVDLEEVFSLIVLGFDEERNPHWLLGGGEGNKE